MISNKITKLCLLACCISTLFECITCFEKEMTVVIDAGKRECFFQHGKAGEMIDIEYQVIDGGHGDLDINFQLIEPTARVIYSDIKRSDNVHRYQIPSDGDYNFCFDNQISKFNRKVVFFELIIDREDENGDPSSWKNDEFEGLTPEEFYDVKVDDIKDSVGKIRTHLTRARQIQDYLRSTEARDRNIAEENNFKVNAWSMFQVLIMLAVGGLQVIMVKSLFDSNSKVHKIWTKFS